MKVPHALLRTTLCLVISAASLGAAQEAVRAQTPTPTAAADRAVPADGSGTPDDSVLGTVVVTGGAARELPKLAVMPLVTTNTADTTLQLVVRNDLDLSGQFDVVPESVAPSGVLVHETPVDAAAWKAKGVSLLVRVAGEKLASENYELRGSVHFLDRGPEPAFTHRIEATPSRVREQAHRMTDALLGALSGRPGGFASHMVYSSRVGKSRQVFRIDGDGFNLHAESPEGETAIAPAFGPRGEVYYALSTSYSPFHLVRASNRQRVPLSPPGSVYGIAFTPDHASMAVAIASEGTSRIYVGKPDGSDMKSASTEPLANHPVLGPKGKLAYVAGGPRGQRVYVDHRAISPAGFNASAPTFCDGPNGLLVVFTVGVGAGADLVATDVRGGNLMRLTQGQGANSYPACSPDGRLLAFFSTRKSGKGPGLYVAPLANPGRTRLIAADLGESLRWDALPSGG